MKQTVYMDDFTNAFESAGRWGQFSKGALHVLYEYLSDLEEDTGAEIDLDVVALCCEYAEGTLEEVATAYGIDDLGDVKSYLEDEGVLVGETVRGTLVYRQF